MRRIMPPLVTKDASVVLLAVIILFLVGSIAVGMYALRGNPIDQVLSGDRVISVLFVFEKDRLPLGTYVFLCYPETRRAAIFDIPGEIGMLLRQINRVDRIDAVYNPQSVSDYENQIKNLLGADIAFSVVFTVENLTKTVDLIGGVELFIPTRVEIRSEDSLVLFPSGINRLDGDKAAGYIGYGSPEEDTESTVLRRQRFFINFLKRLAETNDIFKNQVVSQMYQSFMQTDLNQRTRIRLFDEIADMDLERVSIQSVGGNYREVSGKMLLIPYYDGNLVKDIVRETLGSLTRPTEGFLSDRVFTVEILNGTSINGLAGRTAEILRGFGYDIISTGNADHSGYEKTVVIDRSGYENIAKNFAGIIRCNNINHEAQSHENPDAEIALQGYEYRSDFTLIIGRDFNGRYVTGN